MDAGHSVRSRSLQSLPTTCWLMAAGSIACLSTPASAQQSSPQLEEIIVTANRTETELSKTPVALSVLSGDALISAGITNPTELADRTPGLSIDRNNGLQLTIRGVSSTDNTEKGDPSAAFLLDGIYIARPQAQEVSFFDLARTEVVRGPQGTLYGRNTTAGLLNVISARPAQELGASVDATIGDFNARQITGMVNVPVSDAVALRAAVNYDRRDTYMIGNPQSPFSNDPAKDNLSARVSALFKISNTMELVVRADYSEIQGKFWREDNFNSALISNLYEVPLRVPPPGQRGINPRYIGGSSEDRRRITYDDSRSIEVDDDTWGLMAEFNWDLSDATTLTYIGSYREFDRYEQFPLYLGSVPGVTHITNPSQFTGSYDQDSHELRIAYDGGRLDFQAGAYYFKETSGIELAIIGLNAPTPGTDGYVFGFPQNPTESESKALFGQATFSLMDRFRLTAGLRYTEDEKSRVGATINHRSLDEPLDFTQSASNPLPDSLNSAAVSYEETTWKAGLEFDATDTTLVYATASTGYKAGGFNDGCLAGDANCNSPINAAALFYDPEELTAYEIGVRSRIGNVARVFASFFHYDYEDLQLSQTSSVCGGPCQVTSNAGQAEVDGVELEAQYEPNDRNRIDASISWLDARYTDYEIVPGVNFAGEPLNRSPEWTLGLGYTHTFPLSNGAGIVFDVHSRYVDSYAILSTALVAQFEQPSFTKTDVSIGYHSDGNTWYVEAFAKNLEDEVTLGMAAISVAFPGLNDGTVSLGAPRTYGLRLGYRL